ncbi:MAG: transcriptional regulator [Candidatus Riflebacteria bacterium]|nr:transcriptional regulator [Candidatus Riflebacteria bacterium]
MASKKRNLFSELMEGVEAMRAHRQGKVTLKSCRIEGPVPLELTAEVIRDTRERLGVSRCIFARKLRVNERTLERWEEGRARPNPQAATLILLVRRFPDTFERLATLDEELAAA